VTIRVFQGEREMAATTSCSASSTWSASRRRRAACRRSKVTFDIDANGIVNVSAKDKGTGKEQQIRIQASGGLSDATSTRWSGREAHAEEDKQRAQLVEARQPGEALIHSTKRPSRSTGSKSAKPRRSAIERACPTSAPRCPARMPARSRPSRRRCCRLP
jgi:molecular chaperone DnaK